MALRRLGQGRPGVVASPPSFFSLLPSTGHGYNVTFSWGEGTAEPKSCCPFWSAFNRQSSPEERAGTAAPFYRRRPKSRPDRGHLEGQRPVRG